MAVLSAQQIDQLLGHTHGWGFQDNTIRRQFQFPTFRAAVAFVNRVADLAEAADHHPDITITYTKILLVLSSHDEGGVTQKDIDLARQIDAVATESGG